MGYTFQIIFVLFFVFLLVALLFVSTTKAIESAMEEFKKEDEKLPLIKGNISSKGEKVYHMPHQRVYNLVVAEEVFFSEEEALEAGYRKSTV